MRTKHNDGSTVVGKVVGKLVKFDKISFISKVPSFYTLTIMAGTGNSKSGYYTFGGKQHTLTSYEVLTEAYYQL